MFRLMTTIGINLVNDISTGSRVSINVSVRRVHSTSQRLQDGQCQSMNIVRESTPQSVSTTKGYRFFL